jgi:hypothetical protein
VAERLAKARGASVVLDAALRAAGRDAAAAVTGVLDTGAEPPAEPALPAGAPRAGARARLALIDVNRHYSDALWAAARDRGVQVDLFADVAHFRQHASQHHYGAVILDFDPGVLAGVDLGAALTSSLGSTPAVIVTPADHAATGGETAPLTQPTRERPFVHVPRNAAYDAVLDAALELAGRTDLS